MPQRSIPTVPSSIQTRDEALAFLLGRIDYERTPLVPYGQRQLKLDRMRQLLVRLGNPDAGLPIVHVAGTKGKGSTCAYVAAVLTAAGYDAGLFSSPHLERIEERFAVNGVPCPADEFVTLVERLRPIVQAMDHEADASGDSSLSPTYFELTTAIALMHFSQLRVDAAVLEVGLGGRLDSTNVCQPAVTVITSISFDHTKQLGNTLAEIAAEKAGIIKPGVPVLCGPLDAEPRRVIAEIAQEHGCRMIEAGSDFRFAYEPPQELNARDECGRLDFESYAAEGPFELRHVPLRMMGEHQAANAALALATALELRRQGWLISTQAMHAALSGLALPARVEVIRRSPTVVLDVAHNVASARALAEVLRQCFSCERRTLVLAATRDKDVAGIVRELVPYFRRVIVTEYRDNPRAVPTAELAKTVLAEFERLNRPAPAACGFAIPNPLDAWKFAASTSSRDELICITGSFFIAAELRPALLAGGPAALAAASAQSSRSDNSRGK